MAATAPQAQPEAPQGHPEAPQGHPKLLRLLKACPWTPDERLKPGSGRGAKNKLGALLRALEQESDRLGVPVNDRAFRADYTPNYFVVFPDYDRRYSPDVLVAAYRGGTQIEINGTVHLFPRTVTDWAGHMCTAWGLVFNAITTGAPLTAPLQRLEDTFPMWEVVYIKALIRLEMEVKARLMVAAQGFTRLERDPEAYVLVMREVNHVNSLVTGMGTGRSDMTLDVLWKATEMVQQSSPPTEDDAPLISLALSILGAWEDLRQYFIALIPRINALDVGLSYNVGLVQHLGVWELAWTRGKRYLMEGRVRGMLAEDLRVLVQALEQSRPLQEWLSNSEAAGLLAVPRILVTRACQDSRIWSVVDEFAPEARETTQFRDMEVFLSAHGVHGLVQAMAGGGGLDVEDGVSVTEHVSMQVQRARPEGWNDYLQVVLACVSGTWVRAPRTDQL